MPILTILEAIIGRRMMWKIGRRLYLHARREGSLDFETNGEAALQAALARRSAASGRGLKVVDVGANYGQWSRSMLERLAAAKAPSAQLILFEPVPEIRATLAGLAADFPDHRIEVVASAVSNEPSTMKMVVTALESGTHHLASADYPYEGRTIDVPVTTLDVHLAGAAEPIDIVKIDAEGFDPKVIGGMRDLLARRMVGVVQFEYSILFIRSRSYLYDIFGIAREFGYKVALLTRQGFEVHEQWHADLEHFYASSIVMLEEKAIDLLPAMFVHYRPDNTHG